MADKKISALTSASTPLAGTEVLPIVQSGATVKVAVNDMLSTISSTSPAVDSTGNMFLRATDTLGTGVGQQITMGGKYNASSYYAFGGISSRKENATNNNVAGYTDILTTTSGGALTARMRFNSTGDGTMLNGNLVIGTSGKGIDFSATSGSGTSELLADYEEGTFTPTIVGTGGAGVGTYTTQVGQYTKVGRQVTVQIALGWSAHTATGDMFISGLPFTCSSVRSAISASSYDMTLAASNYLGGRVTASGTTIELLNLVVGGGAWSGVAMDTSVVSLIVTATYTV